MGTLLSNPSFYWRLGHTERVVAMALFVLFLPASGYHGFATYCRTRENAKWQIDPALPSHPILKDPPVPKILQRGNFGTGSKMGKEVARRYREGSEVLVFLGERKRQENGTDNEKVQRYPKDPAVSKNHYDGFAEISCEFSQEKNPKNLLRLFFASKIIFYF